MEYIYKNRNFHGGILILFISWALLMFTNCWALWFLRWFLTESPHLVSAQSWNVRPRFYKDPDVGREGMDCFALRCSQTVGAGWHLYGYSIIIIRLWGRSLFLISPAHLAAEQN